MHLAVRVRKLDLVIDAKLGVVLDLAGRHSHSLLVTLECFEVWLRQLHGEILTAYRSFGKSLADLQYYA
jgi:hypothetical protein